MNKYIKVWAECKESTEGLAGDKWTMGSKNIVTMDLSGIGPRWTLSTERDICSWDQSVVNTFRRSCGLSWERACG